MPQFTDEETGLHYNLARYYAPDLGRYILRDPLDFAAGPNPYLYCYNDPVGALGREMRAQQFLKLFAGQLPLSELDEQVEVAIAVPSVTAQHMLSNPRTREFDIHGTHVLARYLVGLEELFPSLSK